MTNLKVLMQMHEDKFYQDENIFYHKNVLTVLYSYYLHTYES